VNPRNRRAYNVTPVKAELSGVSTPDSSSPVNGKEGKGSGSVSGGSFANHARRIDPETNRAPVSSAHTHTRGPAAAAPSQLDADRLIDTVADHLVLRPYQTATDIARAIRRRDEDVRRALRHPRFRTTSAVDGRHRNGKYYFVLGTA
jgi:hypothetical protein